MAATEQVVLPGSRVRIQWRREAGAWRCFTESDAGAGSEQVEWRVWAGDPESVIKISVAHEASRWWVAAGELSSPDSVVQVRTEDGFSPAVTTIEGRVWACEWSGDPRSATISVPGRHEFEIDFRRKLHYLARDSAARSSGGYQQGWISYAPPEYDFAGRRDEWETTLFAHAYQ